MSLPEPQSQSPLDKQGRVGAVRKPIPSFTAGGDGPQITSAKAMNRIVDTLNALSNLSVIRNDKNAFTLTDSNAVLEIAGNPASDVTGTSGAAAARMFKLVSVQGDYLTCHTWDGTTEGSTAIFIAKDPKLRESLGSESIFGVTHMYSYSAGPDGNNDLRKDNDGTRYQFELVTPPWLAAGGTKDIIYAIPALTGVLDGGGNPIFLLNVSPFRTWAKAAPLATLPATPASATDSTNGYDGGLIEVDGNFLYVSTGVNTWKRVAISSW